MSRPVFIEAALNGPWSQRWQPLMPITTDTLIAEGIDCARAGASIIHIHVYDPTLQQFEDFDAYKAVIEGIREHEDVIVYPTLPLLALARPTRPLQLKPAWKLLENWLGRSEWSQINGTTQITNWELQITIKFSFIY